MGRRRKRRNKLYLLFIILVILIAIFLIFYKNTYLNNDTKKSNNNVNATPEKKEDNNKTTTTNNNNEISENPGTVTSKPSNNESAETKNEQTRRGGHVALELIGEDEVTINKGSKYTDAGVKATYDDGTDASSEIEVDNTVNTNKEGTYTVTYYYGNTIVIRRVTVK